LKPVLAAVGCFVLALGLVLIALSYLLTGYISEQIDPTLYFLGVLAVAPIGAVILVIGVAARGKTGEESL